MSKNMLGQITQKLVLLPEEALGTQFDLLQKLTGSSGDRWLEGLKKMLRGEQPWRIPPIFTITVKARKQSAEAYIQDLENRKGRSISERIKQQLRFHSFDVEKDTTYTFAVVFGSEFTDAKRTTENILAVARKRGYSSPPIQAALYVWERFSARTIQQAGLVGLYIMHQFPDSFGGYWLPAIGKRDADFWWLGCEYGESDVQFEAEDAFVFLASSDPHQ